jgi:hypothetical protein
MEWLSTETPKEGEGPSSCLARMSKEQTEPAFGDNRRIAAARSHPSRRGKARGPTQIDTSVGRTGDVNQVVRFGHEAGEAKEGRASRPGNLGGKRQWAAA